MDIPSTFISLHMVERITASSGIALGAPITLQIRSERYGSTSINVFFRDGDADYTARLIEAINSVQPRRPIDQANAANAVVSDEVDAKMAAQAAAAADYAYKGFDR